ncbi:Protein of unknown function [Cotesia congregata]|uniref:Uncharacterized protein n=1 Tax=Cotesia congregata TaxID=51543 RepID=A0A8J2H8L9_COTCN|nr:Protein of unknown function [Cotesia congregata]
MFSARKQLVADSIDKLVEFNLYPCLSGEKGADFITSDFEKKFESAQSFKTSWPNLRATFEDFILSKRIDDVDAATQVIELAELIDDDKDAVIFSLLPLAIKSLVASTKSDELEAKITARRQTFITNKEAFYPFMVFVGPVSKPVEFYNTALEALDVTFKIFLLTSCPFPKFVSPTYILLKKVVYQITSRSKSTIQLQKALLFFEKKLQTKFD